MNSHLKKIEMALDVYSYGSFDTISTLNTQTTNLSNISKPSWKQRKEELNGYLKQMSSNPYAQEIVDDMKKEKIEKINKIPSQYHSLVELNDDFTDFFLNDDNIPNFEKLKQLLDIIPRHYRIKMNEFCIKSIISLFDSPQLVQYLRLNWNDFTSSVSEINSITIKSLLQSIKKKYELENNITNNIVMEHFNPTLPAISTMTMNASLNSPINTDNFYKSFNPSDDIYISTSSTVPKLKPELRNQIIGFKDMNPKNPVKGYFPKEPKGTKGFYNCVVLCVLYENINCVNVKVFTNGNLHMTGVRTFEAGKKVADIVYNHLLDIPETDEFKVIIDRDHFKVTDVDTMLINTDYNLNMPVERNNLVTIFRDNYGLNAFWDSDGYPGVKLEYFWNKNSLNSPNEGKCKCTGKCNGKGFGNGDNDCKKVVVSIFQSGSALVVGGRNIEQINSAYRFVNKIISENLSSIKSTTVIKKKAIIKPISATSAGLPIYLNKNSIKNNDIYNKLLTIEEE